MCDKPICHSTLDGHHGAQNANHPDAIFSSNTIADKSSSFWANRIAFETAPGPQEPGAAPAQEHLYNASGPDVAVSRTQLFSSRANRIAAASKQKGEADLLIKGPTQGKMRLSSVLMREWTGSELGMLGLGGYALYSLLTRL